MKYWHLIFRVLFLSFSNILSAQHAQPAQDKPNTLFGIFKQGHVNGHIRNYFMSTLNEGELNDYYANAVGGAIRYETSEFHGFHLGVAGIFTYKAFSNDLNTVEPATGEIAKWEHELFDILDFDNFNDLDRLEELYLQYRFPKGRISYGKLEIEDTPLLNKMDGRMKPFAFNGVWFTYHPNNEQELQVAWLNRISPRSTVEWFDFNEGIGLTDNGFQPDGTPAQYHEHQESRGVALMGYQRHLKHLDLKFYHWYLHHLSHTSWIALEYRQAQWTMGLQYALQFPDFFQKDLVYNQRYVQPEENGQALSGQLQWEPGAFDIKAAYTRAFSSGRFLFPRELGRDQFYTSISRSRLDGFGNTGVLSIMVDLKNPVQGLITGLAFTEVSGPERNDTRFNKYNLDSYWQLNTHLEYQFQGFLEGMRLNFLYVYKQNRNDSTPEAIFNRSNYHQFNLVLNFDF